jgi:hypothetical protein
VSLPVSLNVEVNLNSLRIVSEELNITIKQAATELEAFLADSSERSYLNSSVEHIRQIAGVCRLLEFPGAIALAVEMQTMAEAIAEQDQPIEGMVAALTHAFFVLPHYLEYISTRQRELPIMMVEYVNEMRIARRAELLNEHQLYPELSGALSKQNLLGGTGSPDLDELQAAIGRLRHMYQVGLLGVINDKRSVIHFQLMSRALSRATAMLGDHSSSGQWLLAKAVIDCFAEDALELTLHRKRYLAAIEKLLRNYANKGDQALNAEPDAELTRNLLMCLTVAGSESASARQWLAELGLPNCDVTDRGVAEQRVIMHGPSMETFDSVINALREELRTAKEILEVSSQHNAVEEEEMASLRDVLSRVADTLMLLNLTGPQDMLREQLQGLDDGSAIDFNAAADVVLFVDSSLGSLKRHEFSADELNQVNDVTRREIIANSQLAEAERVVLEEAKSCISLAKRAITSYVDSNFELAHIANVATTLNTIRGAVYILNYHRAAAVVKSCSEFISDHINQHVGGQRHQLLETLADALISIEYYLNEIEVNREPNEMILEIAEESLDALGFPVVA